MADTFGKIASYRWAAQEFDDKSLIIPVHSNFRAFRGCGQPCDRVDRGIPLELLSLFIETTWFSLSNLLEGFWHSPFQPPPALWLFLRPKSLRMSWIVFKTETCLSLVLPASNSGEYPVPFIDVLSILVLDLTWHICNLVMTDYFLLTGIIENDLFDFVLSYTVVEYNTKLLLPMKKPPG